MNLDEYRALICSSSLQSDPLHDNYNTIDEVVNTSLLNMKYRTGECPGHTKDMVEANGKKDHSSIVPQSLKIQMDQIQALLKKEHSLKKINYHLSNNKHGDRIVDIRHIYVPRACSYQTFADQRDHRCAYEEENIQEEQIQDYESDAIYRFRMSTWSYKVVDFFGASREIVTIAFNYLDRFIDSGVYCW